MTDSNRASSLRVLLLAEDFYPKESGGAFEDWNVASHLAESGDTVTVITPRNGQTTKSETVDGVEIRRPFRGPDHDTHPNSARGIIRRLLFVVLAIPYLCCLCWGQEFDVVYSTNHIFHFPATFVSRVFQISHISLVSYSPSNRESVSLTEPLVLLEQINFRYFMGDQVLCRTPQVQKILSKVSAAEVERVDGIVDEQAVIKALELDVSTEFNLETDIQIIFVGRLVGVKNPTKLPQLVSQSPPEYSLLIVGDGPKTGTVKSNIHELDLNDRIHLTGRLSHEETLQAIYDSDILILPSKTEAYPTVVFESLSLNTPVLATPVGVLPTIEHPNLTLAQLDDFSNTLLDIDLSTEDRIDEQTLQRFSVNQFVHNVRNHMQEVVYN